MLGGLIIGFMASKLCS